MTPASLRAYVRSVETVNRAVGRVIMYMIFVMIGVLLYSALSRTLFNLPLFWVVEMSQFLLVGYYLLGGGYSMQLGDHVRMDLFYSRWSDRGKARMDAFTVLFLIFYLAILLYGALSSTSYALEYGERSYSAWRPYMAPVKIVACVGIFLMLLQAIAELIKDLARLRGEAWVGGKTS